MIVEVVMIMMIKISSMSSYKNDSCYLVRYNRSAYDRVHKNHNVYRYSNDDETVDVDDDVDDRYDDDDQDDTDDGDDGNDNMMMMMMMVMII